MRYLVFGSLNVDRVYTLPRLPEKGETLSAKNYEIHVGGKGLNQALALKKAGAEVFMAGRIGPDGAFLTEHLQKAGVNTLLVKTADGFTGHAVIEVDGDGQNQMVLFPGENRRITREDCDKALENFEKGDALVLQYETSEVEYIAAKAKEKGLITVFNPSPFTDELKDFDLGTVDVLILNEDEGARLTDRAKDVPEEIAAALSAKLGSGKTVILTLGADGAIFTDGCRTVRVPAFRVNAVDTTGAGDTFTGYAVSALLNGTAPEEALTFAAAASALAVMKKGAAETIPDAAEVRAFLQSQPC